MYKVDCSLSIWFQMPFRTVIKPWCWIPRMSKLFCEKGMLTILYLYYTLLVYCHCSISVHNSNDLRHIIISNHLFVAHSAMGTMSFLWFVGVLKLIKSQKSSDWVFNMCWILTPKWWHGTSQQMKWFIFVIQGCEVENNRGKKCLERRGMLNLTQPVSW